MTHSLEANRDSGMDATVSGTRVAEKNVHSIAEVPDREIGRLAQALLIAAFNKNCSTTCGARTIDIAPAIADDITSAKVNFQVGCCSQDHARPRDRKSTRLNSSHQIISYAVFCLKKKNKT